MQKSIVTHSICKALTYIDAHVFLYSINFPLTYTEPIVKFLYSATYSILAQLAKFLVSYHCAEMTYYLKQCTSRRKLLSRAKRSSVIAVMAELKCRLNTLEPILENALPISML